MVITSIVYDISMQRLVLR